MELIFESRRGIATLSWSDYALLRDNVQHYLETAGQARYEQLHAIERAVDGEPSHLNALGLRREVRHAWAAFAGLTLAECAVSLRTRAFLTGCGCAPAVKGTVLAKLSGWPLPLDADDAQLLQARLSSFVETLLAITDRAEPADRVSVVRGGHKAPNASGGGPNHRV